MDFSGRPSAPKSVGELLARITLVSVLLSGGAFALFEWEQALGATEPQAWTVVTAMFTVGDKHHFIPMWTYPFGIVYRTDVVNDPKFRSFYEKKTGKKWVFPPTDIHEYAEMAKAAKAFVPKGMYGCAMQGAKVDPLVMELTNYVYALDGDYYDRKTWKASFDSEKGREALKIYKDLIDNAAQPGANGANFDDAFNTFGQGKAVFAVTHNFLMPWLLDKTNSVVYDKVDFVPLPGGGLLGG